MKKNGLRGYVFKLYVGLVTMRGDLVERGAQETEVLHRRWRWGSGRKKADEGRRR